MGKLKWGDYLGGFLTVSIHGNYPEKIINLALSRGIFLWDIKKSPQEMIFKVKSSSYQALLRLAEEHGFELGVLDRQGLPFYRQVLQRRRMFIWGALFFIAALYLLSSFVWSLQVNGCQRVPKQEVLKSAARHGLYEGALKWKISKTAVEQAILRDIYELSYVEVDVKGVKANIKVVEKILPGEDISGPCHLVASRDGIVESLLVLKGQPLVKEGDTVARGDILISGIVFPEQQESEAKPGEPEPKPLPYMVRARGQVKARVWYEGYGECPLAIQRKVLTGEKAERISIRTPWGQFCLRKATRSFRGTRCKTKSYLWDSPLGPVGWETTISRQQKVINITYSEEEALEIAQTRAMENLKQKMTSGEKVLDTRMEMLSSPTEPLIRVKAYSEIIEEIGVAQPINVEGNTD